MEFIYNYDELKKRILNKYVKLTNFSNDLGISQPTLSKRLNNKSDFSFNEIVRTVELLEIDVNDIHDCFFTTKQAV